jgi:hypothetical protein
MTALTISWTQESDCRPNTLTYPASTLTPTPPLTYAPRRQCVPLSP